MLYKSLLSYIICFPPPYLRPLCFPLQMKAQYRGPISAKQAILQDSVTSFMRDYSVLEKFLVQYTWSRLLTINSGLK